VKSFERISFAGGTLLLVWLVYRMGPATLRRALVEVGWGFLLVLALHALTVALNAVSWRLVTPGSGVSLSTLAPMLVAADGLNAVSPVGLVGGEMMRVNLLRRRIPAPDAVGSVGLAAMAQFLAQALFLITGLPFAASWIADGRLRLSLRILCGALLVLASLVLWIAASSRALRWASGRLERIDWLRRRWESAAPAWRGIVERASESLRRKPAAFAGAVGASLAAWQLGAVETYLLLRLLGRPVGFAQAFAIEILATAIEGLFFFVPAKMGTEEGGRVVIFLSMGLTPAVGFALGFLRRLRELAWAAAGFVILAGYRWGDHAPVLPRSRASTP